MARSFYLAFGIAAYLIFFATFLYLIGFVADAAFLPQTINRGPSQPAAIALVIDIALVALFGLQHSIMARPAFKAAWTRIVPPPIERSVYVLAASLMLVVMFLFWHPIPTAVWRVDGPAAILLWALSGLGWLMVLASSYLINHFELFGLAQVWRNLRDRQVPEGPLRFPLLYALVRHPLYTGFLIAFWATPVMTVGHLVFAAAMTAYIRVALRYEERDLVGHFGEGYRAYQRRVGMLIPGLGRHAA
ncbi:methanethiol S-methyltransferase [Sphingomonas sp. ID0503]|uniref:methanethiol S-methyltransferase n=1 Tax=Sphingomonas sp. ID0503 TaxID=3399691 RepID=UPI003AFABFF3